MSKTNQVKRILLLGGYPKGYDEPFHRNTLSGKRLRNLLDKHNLQVEISDLWATEYDEAIGIVDVKAYEMLKIQLQEGYKIIALGYHVYHSLQNCGIECEYLPHPACRRKSDLIKLEEGLVKLCR